MMSTAEMQHIDEKNRLFSLAEELEVQWFNYGPQKRVKICREHPEIAEVILKIIELN